MSWCTLHTSSKQRWCCKWRCMCNNWLLYLSQPFNNSASV